MPGNVRKDGKAKNIAFDILGAPATGFTDSFGNKKRMKRKKGRNRGKDTSGKDTELSRFEKINFFGEESNF